MEIVKRHNLQAGPIVDAARVADLIREYGDDEPPGVVEGIRAVARASIQGGRDPRQAVLDALPGLRCAVRETERGLGGRGRPLPGDTGGPPAVEQDLEVTLPRTVREHAAAVSLRIQRIGNADPAVVALRTSLWGKPGPLSPTGARQFLTSPLLRHAMREDLDRWGIPPVHHAKIIGDTEGPRDEHGRSRRTLEIRASWRGGKRTVRCGWYEPRHEHSYLEFPDARGSLAVVEVDTPFSVLGAVQARAAQLAQRAPYTVWSYSGLGGPAAAAWFLVSGEVPTLPAVSVRQEIPGSVDVVSIHALARVARSQDVADAFLKAQEGILGHQRRRPYAAHVLALVGFVEEQLGGPVQTLDAPTTRRLWDEWTRRYGRRKGWAFEEPRQLRDAYLRAREGAFFPDPREGKHARIAEVSDAIERWIRAGRPTGRRRKR